MEWQEAISKSTKGTATRIENKNGKRRTTVRYNDGSGFVLVGEKHKVDFGNSHEATSRDLNGFTDWLPSE